MAAPPPVSALSVEVGRKQQARKAHRLRRVESIDFEIKQKAESFWTSVGWSGVALYAFAATIAAGHFYLAIMYTFFFEDPGTVLAWIFLFFAILFAGLIVYHLCSWKKVAKKALRGRPSHKKCPKSFLGMALVLYYRQTINGKWFLLKLYASEVVESCLQAYNTVHLYTCALPPGFVLGMCMFLALDHFYRARMIFGRHTASSRDSRLFEDVFVDVMCMVLPLSVSFFGYQIPITPREMMIVVAWPTMATLMKLDDIMEENVTRRSSVKLATLQRNVSLRMSRNRLSLYQKTAVEEGLEEQEQFIGRRAKQAVVVFTVGSGLFFFIIGIAAVGVQPECDTLWTESCLVKVPLCGLRESCDCAVLHVDKHNLTSVPDSLGAMKSLRSIVMTRGPLTQLPSLDQFKHLAILNVSENELTKVPPLPKSMQKLNLDMNHLRSVSGLMDLPYLMEFRAAYNNISSYPRFGQRVWDVRLTNNSLEDIVDTRNVRFLEVGGNRLSRLPKSSKLRYLDAPNNQLAEIPLWEALEHLDARGNKLASLPDLALEDIFVHGNPLCSNGWSPPSKLKHALEKPGQGCAAQCSSTCLDMYVGDGNCGLECISCTGEAGDC